MLLHTKKGTTPCIFGFVEKHRWLNACAQQLIERLIYAEGVENGLEFTIVRLFSWIGPMMDFILGIDGPSEGVSRVIYPSSFRDLSCFSFTSNFTECYFTNDFCFRCTQNLLRREPLKLVDGGESQKTFIYIHQGSY
ncbi:putative NAD-dependent epimerase/dehydratase [Helianthus annuus]|nr:putative NAD-dependent epimerase/dehydratase [Helianthus annuus]